MTYFMQDNYNIYDSLPCSAVVFSRNENLDVIYSNAVYNELFGSKYIKIQSKDRATFNEVLAVADNPQSVCFRCENGQGKLIDVRAFVVKISEDRVFAILIDDNENAEEIRELNRVCASYAAAIRGTDEIFYEYVKETDAMTIYFPTKEGKMETNVITGFFRNIRENDFILAEDLDTIASLEDNVKVERRFEARMRLRKDEDFSWYAVAAKPDDKNPGLFVGTARNIQALKDEEAKLKEKVLIDPLSKVYTRAAAVEKIERQLAIRARDCACALIVLDIDNFKKINDTFGHMYGDAVIAMAAGSIKSTLEDGDIMGRFGGDEFFVFIDNAEKDDLEKKLENIRISVLKMRLDQSDDDDISCSIGVALGKGGDEYEELFRQADSALYAAKKNGKNRFEYFDGTYSSEEALSYANVQNEDESNVAHNVTAVALEIASKSTSTENAIINIMRHIGMAVDVDCIQIMEFDTIEDRVYLHFQWWREHFGNYNIVATEKRVGYYNHNDLVLFSNRFAQDKIFMYTPDFKEGFSQKYRDVFEKAENINMVYASNTANESSFYVITFQSWHKDRVWKESEFNDMFEITKILSMYLKSSSNESEREKMLKDLIDYDSCGLYTISKFYDEAGRITRNAVAENGRMGMLHIDIKDFYSVNITHGWEVGNKLFDDYVAAIKAVDSSKALSARITGTDIIIVLFHTTMTDGIVEKIEEGLSAICAPYAEYSDPPILLKAGLCMFQPGWNVGIQIDKAKYAKKGKNPDKCTCYEVIE